jgi:hypothetical protein
LAIIYVDMMTTSREVQDNAAAPRYRMNEKGKAKLDAWLRYYASRDDMFDNKQSEAEAAMADGTRLVRLAWSEMDPMVRGRRPDGVVLKLEASWFSSIASRRGQRVRGVVAPLQDHILAKLKELPEMKASVGDIAVALQTKPAAIVSSARSLSRDGVVEIDTNASRMRSQWILALVHGE